MSDQPTVQKPAKSKRPYKISGHREELVDHYWGSINYVFSLIKASEIKAGLILSFYGILLNLIYRNIGDVITEAENDHILLYIPISLWILCTIASIYYSIKCFMPQLESKYDKNMFYFKDIITKFGSIDEFSKHFYETSLEEEELFHQLGQQIYINSAISNEKFKSVNRSIRLLAVGLVLLFAIGIWYLIITL